MSPAFLSLARNESQVHIPTNQIIKYYSKTLPKEKYQKCQVIQLKQLQWASQIWCRRKFAAWVSSRLWTLRKFTTVGSKASSYFILWEAAFMQSLQVKHLLYLDSKSIIEKFEQLGLHEPHLNSVSHLNVLSVLYRLTFIITLVRMHQQF